MTCNIGNADRAIRFIAGIIIIAVGIYFRSWWGAIGLIFIVTAAIRWCPLYLPFKISTGKSKKAE
ncbi:hypothetical protein AMJ80_01055 [bacterium SM23_31]|nr:MAG: hypothetical protein AMJ80_01055 [bacterium SM23_31]